MSKKYMVISRPDSVHDVSISKFKTLKEAKVEYLEVMGYGATPLIAKILDVNFEVKDED